MRLIAVLSFLITFSAQAGFPRCLQKVQTQMEADTKKLATLYEEWGADQPAIRNPSQLLPGNDPQKAIAFLHGFLGSPRELLDLGLAFQKKGYTVLLQLIPGFAGEPVIQQMSGAPNWRGAVPLALKALSRCFKKVHLGGYSFGASLVIDHVLTNPKAPVGKLLLYAPLLRVTPTCQGVLSSAFRTHPQGIPIQKLWENTFNRDFFFVNMAPAIFNSVLAPVDVEHVTRFLDELHAQPASAEGTPPSVFVVNSEHDRISDFAFAEDYLAKRFGRVEQMRYPNERQLSHRFINNFSNNDLSDLVERSAEFLEKP